MHNNTGSNQTVSYDCGPDLINPFHDIIVVTIWTVLLVYGLVTNVLTTLGILRSPSLRALTSYWLILTLATCDMFMIMISLLHIVPSTAAHDAFLPMYSYRNYMANFLYNIFWYTGVLNLGAMALNRFVSIVYPITGTKYFSRERSSYLIAALFTGGLLIALPAAFECCHLFYNHYCYITDFKNPAIGYRYANVDLALNTCVVTIMIVCYLAIFLTVRRSRLNTQRFRDIQQPMLAANPIAGPNSPMPVTKRTSDCPASPMIGGLISQTRKQMAIANRELRLLIQFLVVSIVFAATFATWQVALNVFSSTKWHYFFMTSLFFVNNATNPTVYMIFNSALRTEIRNILCAFRPRQQTSGDSKDNVPQSRKPSYGLNCKLVVATGQEENEALSLLSDPTEKSNGNDNANIDRDMVLEESELNETSRTFVETSR